VDRRAALGVAAAWLGLAVAVFALAAPRVQAPGLYYDEAFLGQQAKDFFEPGRGLAHPGSTREVELFGRPFPLRNAVYLGALKSQLLIPVFAVFGTDVPVLRLATLGTSLAALLFAMLWARRAFGTATAIVGGVLVASDPSWGFLSLHEWGPFTTLFLCRAAGLWLVTAGWTQGRPGPLAAGGVCLGLGVYARADFLVVLAALALALGLVRPDLVRAALRERRSQLAVLAFGMAVGAAPMLVSVADLLATSASPVLERRGDLGEKLRVLWSLADGSHFHRLMQVGGRFDRMFDVEAPAGGFGLAVLAACALGVLEIGRRVRRGERSDPLSFLLLASLLVSAGTLALPGAVRAHHLMNALPFPHLLVAALGVAWWRRRGGSPAAALARRAVLVLAGAALLAGNAALVRQTSALVEATGGRGRWTDALRAPAAELEADPARRGVSLDWGFHEPLLFLTHRARLVEPIWGIREAARGEGAWRQAGAAGDLYFVHDRDYDLFGFGPAFLAAARAWSERAPGSLEIRAHRDREGGVAFHTVRFAVEHEITYRGSFRIRLLAEGDPREAPR
jgi:hypothetical protein